MILVIAAFIIVCTASLHSLSAQTFTVDTTADVITGSTD